MPTEIQSDSWWDNSTDFKYDNSFSTQSDTDWMSYISELYNSPVANQVIGSAVSGGMAMYNDAQKSDQADKQFNMTREDSNAWREKQMEQQQAQFDAELALQQAMFDDKVQTRARHNASIAVKPNSAKKVSFGGK